MAVMRDKWTDERLDDLNKKVDDGFARVDARFAQIDQRFAQVDQRFAQIDQRFAQVDTRFDSTQKMMWQAFAWQVGIQLTFFLATIGFIAAQT